MNSVFKKKTKPTLSKEKQKELGLTDANLKELVETFCFFDKNSDGYISADELETALRKMGENPTPEDVQAMIQRADTVCKDNKVEFLEFIDLMRRAGEQPPVTKEQELRQLFKIIDKNHSGYINEEELKIALRECGENLTDEEIKATFAYADTDKDGKISFEEFSYMLMNPHDQIQRKN